MRTKARVPESRKVTQRLLRRLWSATNLSSLATGTFETSPASPTKRIGDPLASDGIVVHATFPLDPAKREAALETIEDLVEQSRAEAGTIEYRAAMDLPESDTVRFVERYEDADAFEAHTETEHFGAFEAALPDLLAGEPGVLRSEVESATKLEL